jgi:catechol 2,3-dioxygenase-like lactoylglutathione lyase family enzyme
VIKGINHITLAVSNLEKSFSFYRDVLGFKPLMRHSKGAYFLAGDLWFCLDLDTKTRKEALPEYTHFAFTVGPNAFDLVSAKIRESGAKVWKENVSEGDSLYFLDPDGHKLEIHVGDWKSRIKSAKEKPWNETVVFFDE